MENKKSRKCQRLQQHPPPLSQPCQTDGKATPCPKRNPPGLHTVRSIVAVNTKQQLLLPIRGGPPGESRLTAALLLCSRDFPCARHTAIKIEELKEAFFLFFSLRWGGSAMNNRRRLDTARGTATRRAELHKATPTPRPSDVNTKPQFLLWGGPADTCGLFCPSICETL